MTTTRKLATAVALAAALALFGAPAAALAQDVPPAAPASPPAAPIQREAYYNPQHIQRLIDPLHFEALQRAGFGPVAQVVLDRARALRERGFEVRHPHGDLTFAVLYHHGRRVSAAYRPWVQ